MESYFSRTYHCFDTKSKNEYIRATEYVSQRIIRRERERQRQEREKVRAKERGGLKVEERKVRGRGIWGIVKFNFVITKCSPSPPPFNFLCVRGDQEKVLSG